MPECFAPFKQDTKYFQWPKKEGPVPDRARQRLRRQHLAHPDDQDRSRPTSSSPTSSRWSRSSRSSRPAPTSPPRSARSRTSSTRAMTRSSTIAVNPTAFGPVIKRANKAGVVLVPFDNMLDTDRHHEVNEDQLEIGKHHGPLADQERRHLGQDPRGARPARQLGRPRPASGLPRDHGGARQQVRDHRGRRQLGRRHRAEGDGRRGRRAKASSTACSSRAARPVRCAR